MNKKVLIAGITATAGLLAEVVIHGYLDIMAKPLKVQSAISYVSNKASEKNMARLHSFMNKKLEWINQQDTEKIFINSERGDKLCGFLTKPEQESKVFVFFAHGYRADHNGDPANFLQYYVEKRGYNFLCVDHVTCGESGGNWVGFDYFEHKDSLKWLDYLIERFGKDIKIIIHGVSMGGATICKMADKVPEQVVTAIADCPFTSALDEFGEVTKGIGIKHPDGLLKIFNTMNKAFAGFDLAETDVRQSVIGSRVPMLFVHGKADKFVPTKMGIELYELCGKEKDILLVEGAEHAQSISENEAGYHQKLDEWLDKYVTEE